MEEGLPEERALPHPPRLAVAAALDAEEGGEVVVAPAHAMHTPYT